MPIIIGTAGHIDHGKTTLVKYLTGVDTDRLEEEKRRGISIVLGFAPLILPDGTLCGVVDVPGHEKFIRQMIAGASGIDIVLFIVAADEGVKPQTREHLAILKLLEIKRGIVVLTKCDLVAKQRLVEVEKEVRELLSGTFLSESSIFHFDPNCRVQELKDFIQKTMAEFPSSVSDQIFRLPVDRVFSLKGQGTIVTGTVMAGSFRGDSLWLLGVGEKIRVRSMQVHGKTVSCIVKGQRAALNLAEISCQEISRGDVFSDRQIPLAQTLGVSFYYLPVWKKHLRRKTNIVFHWGTTRVAAVLQLNFEKFVPGETSLARIILKQPLPCLTGDHYILRTSEVDPQCGGTLGGGVILDPFLQGKEWSIALDSAAERILHYVRGGQGIDFDSLLVKTNLSREVLHKEIETLIQGKQIVKRDNLFLMIEQQRKLEEATRKEDFYLRTGLRSPLTPEQLDIVERWEFIFKNSGFLTPSVETLPSYSKEKRELLNYLLRQGRLLRLGENYFIHRETIRLFYDKFSSWALNNKEFAVSEFKEFMGLSRKYVIPLLEYCDGQKWTIRKGDKRIVWKISML